ncbi:MAG: prolyl oligopeptidase family serine peptidase, partial [Crocinitomicaceae bacterium]|nr:prolyl oligopeptidase family serine peptidase [Crocinitomicaceae bacterium]
MKNLIKILVVLFLFNACSEKMEETAFEYPTPLLDRELFFGNPEIAGGQLSPDGQFISFLREYDGIMNIWVKKFDEPFEAAKPLTNSERPLYGYFWTDDAEFILYVKDNDGDENMNVFAVNPKDAWEVDSLPASKNLTPFESVTAQIYHASQINPNLFMIGLNNRDEAWHDLYALNVSTGDLKLVFENKDRITGYDFDWDDNLRMLYRTDNDGNTTFLYKKDKELIPIYETSVTESAYAAGWNEDNTKFYLVTNKGELDLSTLFLMDPLSGEKEKVADDPEGRVDFGGLNLNRNTRAIISFSFTDDKTRYVWKDAEREALYEFLLSQFPEREVAFTSATNDYKKFLISVSGDRFASEAWFFDTATKELIHQYTPRPALKEVEEHLAAMQPISYASRDGMTIPAYLTIPTGMAEENLPLVVLVHGGPKGPRDYWGYNATVQFLANRGYAVLQPNFRASGGYGKAFLNAGDLEWGRLMQDDITWGVKYLIEKGIVDENRVGIMGGSYGGYATLAGLAFTPDLYACGVDIVGPSNIFTLLESIPAYWEAGRAFLHGMVGDPETAEGRKRIEEASPLFHADKINKPLLIIQGANDPRVKKAEADQIVVALRDRGHDVSYILAEDEGHGFRKPINNMAMYAEIERFLSKHLGGRFQEDMPEEVAARLEEMRVDIESVTHAKKGEARPIEKLPVINMPFKEGTETYIVNIALGEQNIPMKVERSFSQKDGVWIVKDHSTGPTGEMKDEIQYNNQFMPIVRIMEQAGQEITMEYGRQEIKMTIKNDGAAAETKTLAVQGEYLTGGPGFEQIIGAMQLDSTLVVQSPDIQAMKIKNLELSANLKDNNTRAVSVVNYDNEQDRTDLIFNNTGFQSSEQIVPEMNGAKITMERK